MPGLDAKIALIFPGQGSQSVGMGRDLHDASPAARAIFAEADAALGFPLSDLCFGGPEDELRDTAVAQPAIATMSVATLAAIEERLAASGGKLTPASVAGHSVGEFAALVACGALDFGQAIRLVGQRGRLMREAGERSPGGMSAVLGLDEIAVEQICREAQAKGVVVPANYNMPGQTVISGDARGLAAATELALARGARKVLPLAVSVANHSPLMAPAAEQFAGLIADLPLRAPRVPLIANGTARPMTSAEEIREELLGHIIRPVRWTESIGYAIESGVRTFWEVGPGQVLTGLVKRIAKDAIANPVGSMSGVIGVVG